MHRSLLGIIAIGIAMLTAPAAALEWQAFSQSVTQSQKCTQCGERCNCERCECPVSRTANFAVRTSDAEFASYRSVDQAARQRGGYRPGQRVVISIGQPIEVNRDWQRRANLNGWTFCVHDHPQPGLPSGVSQHQADPFGVLSPVAALVERRAEFARNCPSGTCRLNLSNGALDSACASGACQ